jgi:hypothetical protein
MATFKACEGIRPTQDPRPGNRFPFLANARRRPAVGSSFRSWVSAKSAVPCLWIQGTSLLCRRIDERRNKDAPAESRAIAPNTGA